MYIKVIFILVVQKSKLEKEISSAFVGATSAESIDVMEKFLSATPNLYKATGDVRSVNLLADYFDILIEQPAAKMGSNPEVNKDNFLN